ncbi:MAG: flagellar hook-basal body complex protein FliE [Acidobacteria bacterium]|nr:flagellar hook-basal body complex protein FliE [Acidobacteriota bacterium]
MSIPSISSISSIAGPTSMQSVTQAAATAPTSGSGSFGSALVDALNSVQATQATSNQLNIQAATGNLPDIAQATIAATRAQVEVQLVSSVRNRAIDAFNGIMNMSA